jgi:hypothetical protein
MKSISIDGQYVDLAKLRQTFASKFGRKLSYEVSCERVQSRMISTDVLQVKDRKIYFEIRDEEEWTDVCELRNERDIILRQG